MANKNFISAGEDKLFGWGQSFNATGKFPVIAKRVWATYNDMIEFVSDPSDVCPVGVILTVVNDTNKDNNGAYFVASCPTLSEPELPVIVEKIGSDVPSALEAENYSAALALITSEELPLGVLIKVADEEIIGEGEAAKKYNSGFYVVNGVGENAALLYLSTSAGTDVTIDTVVTDVETLKTGVADLKSAVDALPETFVTDVKDASGNSLVSDGVAILGDYATKTEVNDGLALKVDSSDYDAKMLQVDASIAEKADASNVYTKSNADSTFVKLADYVEFTQEEKDKLAGVAAGAEVNFIKSVGDNLDVDASGNLTVIIPEVEVPFQSIAEGDKVLTLSEGVLSSTLSYAREEVEGVDSLVLKGVNGTVIGSVPVADFVADGMLDSVTPVEGTNKFKFTFKKVDGSTEDFEVDFGKFVDTYHADDVTLELNSDTNTFNVKAGVFEAAGEAAKAEAAAKKYADDLATNYDASGAAAAVERKLTEYQTSNDEAVAAKVDSSVYTTKMTEIDSSISNINTELANKANAADVYDSSTVDNLLATKVDSSDYDAKVAEIDSSISSINTSLETKAVKADVSAALDLKADASTVYTSTKVDELLATKVDSSDYDAKVAEIDSSISNINTELANKADTSTVEAALAGKVDASDGKSLVDDTLIAKLSGMAEIKSVGDNLDVDVDGKLTVDLSAYATSDTLTTSLATKLDVSATVNGVSFENGVVTIDAGDIALDSSITRTGEDGAVENVYGAATSIQSVLANLSQRIDVLDPNVSGELGITSIVEGNGITVVTSGGIATISVEPSAVEGNMVEVKTDGVYVSDMRSYWEAI